MRPASGPAARLLEQLGRAMHSHSHQHGLFPAQWAALRYFARCKPPHDTAMALAQFQGLAFGSVARTVRTLIEKGLLKKAGTAGRGRAEKIVLTELGHGLLKADPLETIAAAISDLTPEQIDALMTASEAILRKVQGTDEAST
jgi:DNA-binding MarR family transcriptional regulator